MTQCPIAANDSFLYDFQTNNQAGTFWYHSHLCEPWCFQRPLHTHSFTATQYCDGLRGAFILYDPDDPHRLLYDFDDGMFLTYFELYSQNRTDSLLLRVDDYYTSGLVSPRLLQLQMSIDECSKAHRYHVPARGLVDVIPTPYTLINGIGRYPDGPAVPLAVVKVKSGKRYRFRLIAMACDSSVAFSIDGHTLTIIEADGENTAPLVVDSLRIYAGQRYSVVLTANQPVGNYWIRADPDGRGVPGFDGGRNSAILRYIGAPSAEPTTSQTPNNNPLRESNLHALTSPAAPGLPFVGGADVTLTINIDFDFNKFKFILNGATFDPPTVPVLLQILSGAHSAQDLLPPGVVYAFPPNKVIEISIPGLPYSLAGPVGSRRYLVAEF